MIFVLRTEAETKAARASFAIMLIWSILTIALGVGAFCIALGYC